MPEDLRLEVLTDTTFLVRSTEPPSRDSSRRLIALAQGYRGLPGVIEACAGHTTVLVECAPEAAADLRSVRMGPLELPAGKSHGVEVTYDGEDLAWACGVAGVTPRDLVEIHSAEEYLVTMLGSPGFIYLSEVDPRLRLPRLETPRLTVPSGAVAIGGRQTGIYGRSRPGGWRIIGMASAIPDAVPGDAVRFAPL